MARWRDVKKGKIEQKKEQNLINHFEKNSNVLTQIKAVITDVFMLIMPLMYISIYLIFGGREGFAQNMAIGWGYILAPYIIITIIFLKLKGQTPGLKAYEIKLVNFKDHKDINLFQAIVRQLVSVLTTMSIVGLFLPFFRKDKRTIHDIIAFTVIIDYSK